MFVKLTAFEGRDDVSLRIKEQICLHLGKIECLPPEPEAAHSVPIIKDSAALGWGFLVSVL